MTNTRRTQVIINYKGADITQDLAPFLSSFTFNDSEGRSDDISIDLQDRDKKWQGPWLPQKGDEINAKIRTHNWWSEGQITELNCGTFYVDDVSFDGPPDKVSLKALAIPLTPGGKNSKNTRTWENTGLASIAGDLAAAAGLSLLYDAPNYFYDRVDQVRQTDLAFIKELAKKEGIAVKVTKTQLVLYHEATYEAKGASLTFTKGDLYIQKYSFKETAAEEQYGKVEIAYYDNDKKKELKYVYTVPGVDKGPVLKVNKRAKNLDEAMRRAKAEARAKNKGAKTGKLTITGHTGCVQGLTCDVVGFGAFDGKYFIESTSHGVGSGYTVNVNLREVLGY